MFYKVLNILLTIEPFVYLCTTHTSLLLQPVDGKFDVPVG